MTTFKDYKGESLTNYVLRNSKIEEILTDEEFLSYILEPDNHYPFVWLLGGLGYTKGLGEIPKLADIFLTTDLLDRILDDTKAKEKYNAIITYCSKSLEKASDKAIAFILDNINYFISYNIDLIVASKMLDYIIRKAPDKISSLAALTPKVQGGLFVPDNMEEILKIEYLANCFLKFCPEVIIKLFEYEKYRDLIIALDQQELNFLTERFQNYEMPISVQNNLKLVNAISKVENPGYYRSIIRNLSPNNYNLVLNCEEKRRTHVNNLVLSLNEDGIFREYVSLRNEIFENGIDRNVYKQLPAELHGTSLSDEELRKVTLKRLLENICDLFFKDYTKNVLINIKQIVNFMEETKEKIIPDNRYQVYKVLLNFSELSLDNIKTLYEVLNSLGDLASLLYDDLKACKSKSYDMFNNAFLKIGESKNLKKDDLSKMANCDVYHLDGEDFTACVHVGGVSEDSGYKTMSLSVIGPESIGTYSDDAIIFGFEHLDPDRIMHVYKADSCTTHQYSSNRINELHTPKSLLRQTSHYNEILYNEENNGVLLPNYVVCKDKLDEISIECAKKRNLPIVLISTKKYTRNKSIDNSGNYQDYASESLSEDYFGKKI